MFLVFSSESLAVTGPCDGTKNLRIRVNSENTVLTCLDSETCLKWTKDRFWNNQELSGLNRSLSKLISELAQNLGGFGLKAL